MIRVTPCYCLALNTPEAVKVTDTRLARRDIPLILNCRWSPPRHHPKDELQQSHQANISLSRHTGRASFQL